MGKGEWAGLGGRGRRRRRSWKRVATPVAGPADSAQDPVESGLAEKALR